MPTPTTAGPTSPVELSGVNRIDALVSGTKWGTGGAGVGATVSYSFPGYSGIWSTQAPYGGYGSRFGDGEPWSSAFAPLSAKQQDAFKAALQSWADVANISFKQSEDSRDKVGDIRVAVSGLPLDEAAHAYYPFESPAGGDIWLNVHDPANGTPTPGSYGFATLVHELGHALGLKHTFEDGAALPAGEDSQQYSVMSYTAHPTAQIEAAGPMLYDIAAIQHLYGANTSFHTGNDVYTFKPGVEHLRSLWDAGGIDSINLSDHKKSAVVDLNPGSFSSIGIRTDGSAAKNNVSIAFGAIIENAVGGSGNDRLTGNAAANSLLGGSGKDTLSGNAGADSLDGGAGVDSLSGGLGDDSYVLADAGDLIGEAAGQGLDSVRSTLSYVLPVNLEQLILLGTGIIDGTGNALANQLTGNAAANRLDGGAGSDALNGGAGADTMLGGSGDDSYELDSAGDLVSEAVAAGQDSVRTPLSYVLPANLETLVLAGVGSVNGVGNGLNNSLTGNAGANLLNGMAGADTMRGGLGTDRYEVDSPGDLIIEAVDGGSDVVRSTVSHVLGAHLERLVLIGSGATSGTGNILANSLTGNDANNVLDGAGGADTLAGGLGDDHYRVDAAGDLVSEAANAGLDTLFSTVSQLLAANVERLTLLGTAAINGTGNALGNLLTGNGAANYLDGLGGADTMAGGGGNDVYVADLAADLVSEGLGAGTDTVRSTASHSLAVNVENLVLLGTLQVNGIGNAGDNALTGNGAGNDLRGAGGNDTLDGSSGLDTMLGGVGDDVYYVGQVGDLVSEAGNAGLDTVRSTISFTLGAQLEQLTLLGAAGLTGTGNGLDNKLTGNAGANQLSGLEGSDTLDGGAGNDSLAGGNGADVLQGGADADSMTGDEGSDSLSGGKGTDTLLGGTGADLLAGGEASDHFVFSAIGGGVDTLADFAAGVGGDVLDLAGLLSGFLAGASDANQFISLADAGTHTTVRVDADGGADGFQELCLLQGVTGVSVAGLLAGGNLDLLV